MTGSPAAYVWRTGTPLGQIALLAAIASFAGAGLLLILSALGLVHERRVSPETEVLARTLHASAATA